MSREEGFVPLPRPQLVLTCCQIGPGSTLLGFREARFDKYGTMLILDVDGIDDSESNLVVDEEQSRLKRVRMARTTF